MNNMSAVEKSCMDLQTFMEQLSNTALNFSVATSPKVDTKGIGFVAQQATCRLTDL